MKAPPQKFEHGDVVHVATDLGPSMRHFRADADAIVIDISPPDVFCDRVNSETSYGLLFLDDGRGSRWYHESQLTFVRRAERGEETRINEAAKERMERR